MTKPGVRTSEFWLTTLLVVGALAMGLAGRVEGEWAMGAATTAVGAYTASRGMAKRVT